MNNKKTKLLLGTTLLFMWLALLSILLIPEYWVVALVFILVAAVPLLWLSLQKVDVGQTQPVDWNNVVFGPIDTDMEEFYDALEPVKSSRYEAFVNSFNNNKLVNKIRKKLLLFVALRLNIKWALKSKHWDYDLSYIYELKQGFINKDGAPIKCYKCGNTHFKQTNVYTEGEWGIVEYTAKCTNCGHNCGYWSYGCWMP
jgi:hypothetical protein